MSSLCFICLVTEIVDSVLIPHCILEHTGCGYVASGDSLGEKANSQGRDRILNLVFLLSDSSCSFLDCKKCSNNITLHQFLSVNRK